MDVRVSSKPATASSKKCRNICLAATATFVAVVIIFVILAFTVFKPKHPVTTVNSVGVADMDFSLDIPRFRVDLNVTLDVNISVQNPNKFGFKYTNGSSLLNYRGQVVGEAPVPAGDISAGETITMNLTLTVMADRLLANPEVFSDVISGGALPFNTYARVSGKVSILNLFKVDVVSSTSCDFTIYVANRTVSDQQCKYDAKLV